MQYLTLVNLNNNGNTTVSILYVNMNYNVLLYKTLQKPLKS